MVKYFDYVNVLDFGLVKTQGPAGEAEPGLTARNTVTGTPAYLSPESALGEPVDQRTDIYALGCVAYWMLTGRYVFTGNRPIQIVARHVNTPPVPPSIHSAHPIPSLLETVVLACLERQPSATPATARELCDRLGQCEVEPRTREDGRRWWETRMEAETAATFSD